MRIAILTVLYKQMIESFYERNPGMRDTAYSRQQEAFDRSVSLWAGGWARAFAKQGHEVLSIPINNPYLQHQWAREHGQRGQSLNKIALEQLKNFKPEILWYDYFDVRLLRQVKEQINSINLVVGWSGSSVVDYTVLKEIDLVLSCAPETVEVLSKEGFKAAHLDHAFDSGLLGDLGTREIRYQCVFVGQVFRGEKLHRKREALLLDVVDSMDLDIFSPSYDLGGKDILRYSLKKIAYYGLSPLLKVNRLRETIREFKYLGELLRAKDIPFVPYHPRLKKAMKPPVFGLKMLQTLRQSSVVLNIHADSSSEYASNMRLFETTGAGACLLTDWRKNISDLFSAEKEVVTYRSPEECLEKAKWLIDHPRESEEIAKAGHARTLREHTFDMRVEQWLGLVKANL